MEKTAQDFFTPGLFFGDAAGEFEASEFNLVKLLGSGKWSKVVLVRRVDSDDQFALKLVTKSAIRTAKQYQHLCTERNILRRVQHPFVVSFVGGFETREKIHYIFTYSPGGELFHKLKRHRQFPEAWARTYAAEVVLAIEYLHSLDIVYRDLKPENIVLAASGHIVLIDFGLSKERMAWGVRANSFVGTPEYMAPEMVQQEGHTRSVDWWAVGVLLHEMLCGLPPFYSRDKDQMYHKIVTNEPQYPEIIQPVAQSLLERLLEKKPDERLGAGPGGAEEVKAHAFFKSVDWDKLLSQEAPAPDLQGDPVAPAAEQLSLQDFDFLATIGEGSFGKVMLVRRKDSRKLYAMKALRVDSAVPKSQVRHAQTELAILQKCKCRFVIGVHHQFRTENNLVLIVEFAAGGTLKRCIRQARSLSAATVSVYTAELVQGLRHLHGMHVIHRDLNPSNILLSMSGNLLLADCALAKVLPEGQTKTSTFCGSPTYMAPEMIRGRRYNTAVDWWTLGILVFEMLTGSPPFQAAELSELCEHILSSAVQIPASVPVEANSLIKSLLNHDPKARLHTAEQIRKHSMFATVHWEQLGQTRLHEVDTEMKIPRFEPSEAPVAGLADLQDKDPWELLAALTRGERTHVHVDSPEQHEEVAEEVPDESLFGCVRAIVSQNMQNSLGLFESTMCRWRQDGETLVVYLDRWKLNYFRDRLRQCKMASK